MHSYCTLFCLQVLNRFLTSFDFLFDLWSHVTTKWMTNTGGPDLFNFCLRRLSERASRKCNEYALLLHFEYSNSLHSKWPKMTLISFKMTANDLFYFQNDRKWPWLASKWPFLPSKWPKMTSISFKMTFLPSNDLD